MVSELSIIFIITPNPPPHRRSLCRRYASYWNAFLFLVSMNKNKNLKRVRGGDLIFYPNQEIHVQVDNIILIPFYKVLSQNFKILFVHHWNLMSGRDAKIRIMSSQAKKYVHNGLN